MMMFSLRLVFLPGSTGLFFSGFGIAKAGVGIADGFFDPWRLQFYGCDEPGSAMLLDTEYWSKSVSGVKGCCCHMPAILTGKETRFLSAVFLVLGLGRFLRFAVTAFVSARLTTGLLVFIPISTLATGR